MSGHNEGKEYSLHVRLLGRFQVSVGGTPVEDERWPRPTARALLKLLALEPRHQLHRDQIVEVFWGNAPPESAANSLNKVIHMARRVLEPGLQSGSASSFILRQHEQILLQAPGGLWIDVEGFEQQAKDALKNQELALCEEALASYTGDLLSEDLYEDWVWQRREQLHMLRRELLSQIARIHERFGRYRDGIDHLTQLVRGDPADEDAHRRLMKLYALAGQRRQALTQFKLCREILRKDLDTGPDEKTLQLHQQIVAGKVAPPASQGIGGSRRRPGEALAVLPFTNANSDPELEYFGDGISESLITSLSQLPGLRVMARSTVFRYKGREVDPQAVANDLGVRSVLSGRVSEWNKTLTVAVELVDGNDGSLLWGERYRRRLTDILSLQEEISDEISTRLKLELTSADRERLRKRYTDDTEAYQLYLKGRHSWNKRTGVDLEKAIGHLRQAIEKDPTYALAYAGLADCYNLLSLYGVAAPGDSKPKAKAAALRALEIDDSVMEAHTSLAYTKLYYDWDWKGAEEAFQQALRLNKNYPTAHHWYHEFLTAMGRFEEQRREVLCAKELDPLSVIIATEIGWGLYYARRYDDAIRELRKTINSEPNFPVARLVLGLVYLQTDMVELAVAEIERSLILLAGQPFPLGIGLLGYAYGVLGENRKARSQLARLGELSEGQYVSSYHFAVVHAGLGESDKACERLRQACEERYDRLVYLNVEPLFDNLRQDPRFDELLDSVGLTGS